MDYAKESLRLHEQWGGKIEVNARVPVSTKDDLSLAYTPGVAQPCLEIRRDPDKSYTLTRRHNLCAVITDGSAVLGLGDIGPEAGMPVMEGKCVLFKAFADVDAFPLCIRTQDVDEFVRTVYLLSGSFGGINLEDIAAPRCFEIERKLKELCDIPVFHDDQHGTAIITLAGLTNALRVVGKRLEDVKIVVSGAGAAAISISRLLLRAGEIKRLVIPVSKYYNLDPLGTYRMFAYVSHAQLPAEYQSKETRFQVSPGVEVWSKSVGIPDLTGKGEEKSVERTYSIRSMTEGPDRFFYLVVEDNDKVYGVIRIGKRIGQEQFRAEVDMLSRIHLLMPVSPKVFHYLAFALDGTCIANQHWKTTGTIPTLVRDPANGMVTLAGGAVARVGIDFQDPNAGKLTATQLLNENGDPLENAAPLPQPPRSSGLLDLGKEVVNPNR